MSFTLNLTFRGLCALVPSEPLHFQGEQIISGLTALFPDARQSREVGGVSICAHAPKIRFDRPNGPDETWDLAGHHLELVLDDAPSGGVQIRESMEDVPHMAKAVPDAGKVRPDLLQQPAESGLLVAHLALISGEAHGIEKSSKVLEFRLTPETPGTYRGRFACAVQIRIPVAGDQAVLRATPYQPEGAKKETELRPKPGRSTVDVTISNLCRDAEDAKGLQAEGMAMAAPHPLEPDHDYRLYYELLESFAGPFPLPTPTVGTDHQGGDPDLVQGGATRHFGCVPTVL